ncbi:fatty acid--CoA ligase [bacterium]|nr:fatty acid--CoA ligase [bacterium]
MSSIKQQLQIKNLLDPALRYEPDREIYYRDSHNYTYREFVPRVHRLMAVLEGLGIGKGDTVAVLDWDSHRYLEAFFAVPMAGAILHTVNIRLSPDQILYTMNHAKDRLVLVHEDFLPLLEKLQDHLETVEAFVIIRDGEASTQGDLKNTAGEYESLLSETTELSDIKDIEEDTVATRFYTTGTTGNPKGVSFSHRQLVLHTMALSHTLAGFGAPSFNSTDVYMPLTPMFHVHAWGIPYLATSWCNKQIYPGRYEPDLILDLIEKHKVTFSHCVPTILQMVLAHPNSKNVDLSDWKIIIGGSALSPTLAIAAAERGIDIFTGYGMSETCPVLSVSYLREETRALTQTEQISYRVRAGIPVIMVEPRIGTPDGNSEVSSGEGEIQVRAPWLTEGYYCDDEKSEELWKGDWLHTGDVGMVDSEGYLRITDRIKDVIKSGGEWISSIELESLIMEIKGVEIAAVVGVPDEQWGERPCAWIQTHLDSIDLDAIQDHLKQYVEKGKLPSWAIPNLVAVVEEIPRTSVGKIDKKEIRKRISQMGE